MVYISSLPNSEQAKDTPNPFGPDVLEVRFQDLWDAIRELQDQLFRLQEKVA